MGLKKIIDVEIDLSNNFLESKNENLVEKLERVKNNIRSSLGINTIHINYRLKKDEKLEPGKYTIKIDGDFKDSGFLKTNCKLALDKQDRSDGEAIGEKTLDPIFECPAVWIEERVNQKISDRYTVVDHSTIIATHVSEYLKQNIIDL